MRSHASTLAATWLRLRSPPTAGLSNSCKRTCPEPGAPLFSRHPRRRNEVPMEIESESLTIPPPSGRAPLKENVFFVARSAASSLNPLFPYLDAGSIIPCTASFRSGPGAPAIGYFHHSNHVDEVAVVFGSTGDMRTGDVFVGAKKHGVGGWGSNSEFFSVMAITQRQVEHGPQPETI